MISRFCLYAVLRNLRFFDAFFVLFLALELDLSYTLIGLVLAYEKIILGVMEIPLAVVSDRLGRRRALMASFSLAAISFLVFGFARYTDKPMAVVLMGQTIYGLADALRTGTHKAIVLDWLTLKKRAHDKVSVLSRMRFFSKVSAGASALIAGILVWSTGQINVLFFAAAVPTLAAVVMLRSYPDATEGELTRSRRSGDTKKTGHLLESFRNRQVWVLLIPSIVFESQLKLAVAYLQPALAAGSQEFNWPVLGGVGALVVGVYMCVSGGLAGVASLVSQRFVSWSGGVSSAIYRVHLMAALITSLACLGFYLGQGLLGMLLMLGLASLQNMRRPIFVAHLDSVMDSHYRATTLSVESQGRSWLYALSSVALGWVADAFELSGVFLVLALFFWAACILSARRARPS